MKQALQKASKFG